jgi:1-acyl-sn-glycerol-3-phosphate acyltransferase
MSGRPADPRPSPEPLEHSITPLIWATTLAGRTFARGVTRVTITGAVDAVPHDGPLILASNHASNLDGPIVGSWLIQLMGRRIHWLGKKELFDWPIVGWVAANGGVHPVDRSKADVDAFRLASRILADGGALFVFPEGTRSPTGALQEARDGVALLALRSGAPIVPIGIAGSYRVWPKGQRLPHPGGRVIARIGEPFTLAEVVPPDTDRRALKTVATTILMHRIAALLPPEQRGVYAETEPAVTGAAEAPGG